MIDLEKLKAMKLHEHTSVTLNNQCQLNIVRVPKGWVYYVLPYPCSSHREFCSGVNRKAESIT